MEDRHGAKTVELLDRILRKLGELDESIGGIEAVVHDLASTTERIDERLSRIEQAK